MNIKTRRRTRKNHKEKNQEKGKEAIVGIDREKKNRKQKDIEINREIDIKREMKKDINNIDHPLLQKRETANYTNLSAKREQNKNDCFKREENIYSLSALEFSSIL